MTLTVQQLMQEEKVARLKAAVVQAAQQREQAQANLDRAMKNLADAIGQTVHGDAIYLEHKE